MYYREECLVWSIHIVGTFCGSSHERHVDWLIHWLIDWVSEWLTLGSSPYSPDAPRPIDRPFVPHNIISTQEIPIPLLKLQMAPRLKTLMASRSQKGTQIYFSFLSKVPANEPPPDSPTGPLWRGRPIYRAFCISLKSLIFQVSQ